MTFCQSGVTAAVLLALALAASPAQAISIPIPRVQEDARTADKATEARQLLAINVPSGTGNLELGEEPEWTEGERKVDREIQCLATAMYFEARGEPARGQYVVGRVILNRVDSRYYPDSICEVVYQNAHLKNRCQFSFACDGEPNRILEKEAWAEIRRRAEYLVRCDDRCFSGPLSHTDLWTSTHYHADYVNPRWARKLQRTGRIGRHIFYYTSTM